MLTIKKIENAEREVEEIKQELFDLIRKNTQAEIIRRLRKIGYSIDMGYLSRIINRKQHIETSSLLELAKKVVKAVNKK